MQNRFRLLLDITDRFNDLDYLYDIGELELNMSGLH